MRPELQHIVDEASRVLGADTTLEDKDFNLIAYGTQRFDVDSVRQSSILQRRSTRPVREWFEQFGISHSSTPLRTPADERRGFRARICFPARWRGLTYGYLWALDESTALDDPVVARGAQLAEHAAAYLAQLTREHDDDAYAVSDLISPDVDKVRQAVARIADRGVLDRRSPVAAVVVGTLAEAVPHPLSPNLWSLPGGVLADPGQHTTTLVVPLRQLTDDEPAVDAAALAVQLYREELPQDWSGPLVAGVGEPRSDLMELRSSWLEARLAARVARAVPTVRPVARWADLGLYRLLAALPQPELASLILDQPVRRLLETPDPDLLQTVTSYLDHAGNVQDTAAALHIHRQTLYYRLGKAEALTGLSFGNGQHRVRLHLGLMLAPLLEAD
jgi:sugar diacid utilization regulator